MKHMEFGVVCQSKITPPYCSAKKPIKNSKCVRQRLWRRTGYYVYKDAEIDKIRKDLYLKPCNKLKKLVKRGTSEKGDVGKKIKHIRPLFGTGDANSLTSPKKYTGSSRSSWHRSDRRFRRYPDRGWTAWSSPRPASRIPDTGHEEWTR